MHNLTFTAVRRREKGIIHTPLPKPEPRRPFVFQQKGPCPESKTDPFNYSFDETPI